MLKKLILENWKSFRYAELPIDPLTILIGTNASGKSNAIEGLELLSQIAHNTHIETALMSLRGGAGQATFCSEKTFSLKAFLQDNETDQDYLYEVSVEFQPIPTINKFIERFTKANALDQSEKIVKQLKKDASDWSLNYSFSSEHLLKNLVDVFVLNPVPSKMRTYSPLSTELLGDGSNIAGVIAALPDEAKQQVEKTLAQYVHHLPEQDIHHVWAEPVGRLQSDAMLYCEETWVIGKLPRVVDARGMSDGTLRFLAILTALLTRPSGSQLVIEEVDNGLHPSRSSLLLKMLNDIGSERQIDILVTTHNPALLDALEPEMIPFVVVAHRDSETGESKLTPLDDIQNLPKLLASGTLGKLAERGSIERSLSGAN